MRNCAACNRQNLADTDQTCPGCGKETAVAEIPKGIPEILGLIAVGVIGFLAARAAKNQSTSGASGGSTHVMKMYDAVRDAQVRTWGAQQWPNIYR